MTRHTYLRRISALLTIPLLLSSSLASALVAPLREIRAIAKAVPTAVIRVPATTVVIADYPLLRRDFPELRILSSEQIDSWLIDNTGYIATTQRSMGGRRGVNRSIKVGRETSTAYRPPLYGRALVFPTGSGLMDIKGCGGVTPRLKGDSTGLLALEEAVSEFIKEKIVHKVFEHSGSGYETIEHYAVLSYGFLQKEESLGEWTPAAMLLRQAHIRATQNWTCFATPRALKIENLLRRYGITSVGNIDHINIQGSLANAHDGDAIVDFSSFDAHKWFDKPLKDFDPYWIHQRILAMPGAPNFVQPDPRLRVSRAFFELDILPQPWIEKFLAHQEEGSKEHFPSVFAEAINAELAKQVAKWQQVHQD